MCSVGWIAAARLAARTPARAASWESIAARSTRSAFHSPYITRYITIAKGRPNTIVADCRVGIPPTTIIARVSRPVAIAQKMRIHLGPSFVGSSMVEAKLDITRAPESALVT